MPARLVTFAIGHAITGVFGKRGGSARLRLTFFALCTLGCSPLTPPPAEALISSPPGSETTASAEPSAVVSDDHPSPSAPSCPRITHAELVVPDPAPSPLEYPEDFEGHIDYDAMAESVGASIADFFARSVLAPSCIEAIERVSFEGGGAGIATASLRLATDDGPLRTTMEVWYHDGVWRVPAAPDLEGALAMARISRWLTGAPTVDRVSTDGDWAYRMARVRDASGTIFCVGAGPDADDEATAEPWCWHEPRSIEGWWSRTLSHEEEQTSEAGESTHVELGLQIAEDAAEIWEVDLARRQRRPLGSRTLPPIDEDAERAPFWAGRGAPPARVRDDRGAPGAWQPITTIAPPAWTATLFSLGIARVHTPRALSAIEIQRSRESSAPRTLCVRASATWACGELDISREDWELDRWIEHVASLDERTFVVQSSMRMDGGNGEGSGAYGSAELYVMSARAEQLSVVAWLPIGGMEWETTNFCGDDGDPCYHRTVRRARHPWSIRAPGCLELAPLRAESVVTDSGFTAVRRAGRTATPLRRVAGDDALAILRIGFPGDEAATALAPIDTNLAGTWRWDGAQLSRGTCP